MVSEEKQWPTYEVKWFYVLKDSHRIKSTLATAAKHGEVTHESTNSNLMLFIPKQQITVTYFDRDTNEENISNTRRDSKKKEVSCESEYEEEIETITDGTVCV
ncbi:hypothetical protein RUM43_008259 [Polyplax serrata]|uniref:Uncharacterized protein n=1 Tax=Polyplax serrata TaxID=468196 RepID=A0AAN8PYP2_POLSC